MNSANTQTTAQCEAIEPGALELQQKGKKKRDEWNNETDEEEEQQEKASSEMKWSEVKWNPNKGDH